MAEKLSKKREAFVNAYLISRNATQAAKAAGYSERSAHVTGCRLLKDAKVSAEIERRTKENAMEADEVLSRHADIARGTMEDFFSFFEYKDDSGQKRVGFRLDLEKAKRRGKLHLIQEISYNAMGLPKIKLYDARVAQRTIMEHLGLLDDVGSDDKPFVVKLLKGVSLDDL